jgi:hypothetical protein
MIEARMIERAAASAALDCRGAFSASCAFESSDCRYGSTSRQRKRKKLGKGPDPGLRLGIPSALPRLKPDP